MTDAHAQGPTWMTDEDCHSLAIGGVLCRWWGKGEPPRGVAILNRIIEQDDIQRQLVAALTSARAWLEDIVFEGQHSDNFAYAENMKNIAGWSGFKEDHAKILAALARVREEGR